jgi:hypothetical protein
VIARCALILVAACVLAGCGVLDDESVSGTPTATPTFDAKRYGPQHAVARTRPPAIAPKLQTPPDPVAAQLRAGAVGVVDVAGRVAIRPASLDTSDDGTLEQLSWSHWGDDGAAGSGQLRLTECQPNCASGGVKTIPATVTLSGVKTCDGRRYFDEAKIEIDPAQAPDGDSGQPAAYVRAPC